MRDEKGPRPLQDLDGGSAPGAIAGRILCVGGAVADTTLLAARPIVSGTSNPAEGRRSFGGVARNVAVNLTRLGVASALLSCVGDDDNGRRLRLEIDGLGVDGHGIRTEPGQRTAEYVALLEPDRSLNVGVADMAIFERLDASLLDGDVLAGFAWIFADCNCTPDLLRGLRDRTPPHAARLAIDAVSVAKAGRLPADLHGIDLLFLNLDEAASVLRVERKGLDPRTAMSGLIARGAGAAVLTLGAEGLLAGEVSGTMVHRPALEADVADVTGAGDALVAATLAATLAGLPLQDAARWGCLAATLTLEWIGSTRLDLSFGALADLAAGRRPSAAPSHGGPSDPPQLLPNPETA